MKLTLVRKIFTSNCTIGHLSVNGKFECYTLEDRVRDTKVAGLTAIWRGIYKVIVTFSKRFQRNLPLLLNVSEFEGIRIHPGNTDKDTEGCILVGRTYRGNFIGESRIAFDALFAKIQAAYKAGEEISIEVLGTPEGKKEGAEAPPLNDLPK